MTSLFHIRHYYQVLTLVVLVPFFLISWYLNFKQLHIVRLTQSITQKANIPVAATHMSKNSKPTKECKNANKTILEPNLMTGVAIEELYQAGHVDIDPQICPDLGTEIKLLIVVTTSPSHEEARLAVRQTWGHFTIRKDVAVAFIIGATTNETINYKLDIEEELYQDIIRGKFLDSYDNLTLKTISILEWVNTYCPKASFVLKTDDDVFINVLRLLDFITMHKVEERAIYGQLAKGWKPVKNKKSKYYIPSLQYNSTFPCFTTGPAYLFPAQLSRELYMTAMNYTYFKLEDVFITGFVANRLKIKRVHIREFVNNRPRFTGCNVQRTISIHKVKSEEQYDLWRKLHEKVKCAKD